MALETYRAVAQVIADQPGRPGTAVGLTLKLVGVDGTLWAHTSPTVAITDPAGVAVSGSPFNMTTDSGTNISTYFWQSASNSTEGNYLAKMTCTRSSVSKNFVASVVFRLNANLTTPATLI